MFSTPTESVHTMFRPWSCSSWYQSYVLIAVGVTVEHGVDLADHAILLDLEEVIGLAVDEDEAVCVAPRLLPTIDKLQAAHP